MQQLQPGTFLQGGKYRIERVLGQGGFGITYLAVQTSLNRYVAIKELFIGGSGQAINDRRGNQVVVTNSANQECFNQQKAKFKKEAQRLSNLNHPNLVNVHELFEENGTAYFVMDYIDGESLRTKLNKNGRLSDSLVLKYIKQILPALEVAHKQSIWHLDIKPENIMVDRYDHAYLIDFGASKHIERSGTLTTSLALAYTPGYCAPELTDLLNESEDGFAEALREIGPWTDIYSVGATMFNILTENIPPSSKRIERNGSNVFIFPSDVSTSTKDLIIWMMKPNKNERPQDVDGLIEKINDDGVTIVEVPPIPEKPKPEPQPAPQTPQVEEKSKSGTSGNQITIIIACVALLSVLGLFGLFKVLSGSEKDSTGMTQAQKDSIIQNLIDNMVYVEGGKFMMGATVEEDSVVDSDAKPAHQVTLSSFSIGRYEVTQEEWQAVMGSNPSWFKGSRKPVETVSWNDCQEFIRKLNAMTGKNFRLPTEAEWEFASRGGIKSQGYKYSGSNNLNSVAWYSDNSGSTTHDVGQKSPNELGLYDMSGNVSEWCSDWYGNYSNSSQTNPTGAYSGSDRVARGGSWDGIAGLCRSSCRLINAPSISVAHHGLRLATEVVDDSLIENVENTYEGTKIQKENYFDWSGNYSAVISYGSLVEGGLPEYYETHFSLKRINDNQYDGTMEISGSQILFSTAKIKGYVSGNRIRIDFISSRDDEFNKWSDICDKNTPLLSLVVKDGTIESEWYPTLCEYHFVNRTTPVTKE